MGTTHRKGRVLAAALPPARNKTNVPLLSINLAIQTQLCLCRAKSDTSEQCWSRHYHGCNMVLECYARLGILSRLRLICPVPGRGKWATANVNVLSSFLFSVTHFPASPPFSVYMTCTAFCSPTIARCMCFNCHMLCGTVTAGIAFQVVLCSAVCVPPRSEYIAAGLQNRLYCFVFSAICPVYLSITFFQPVLDVPFVNGG